MTRASNLEDQGENVPRGPHRRRSSPVKSTVAMATLLGLVVLAAGCGGAPSLSGSGSNGGNQAPTSSKNSSGGPMAQFVAYAKCMRSHGIHDFPDPVTSPGGGIAFQINGGPGSDLNRNNPTFKAAQQACRSLLPGGGQAPATMSAQKLAAEVKWARCMRSHGLPNFPDPNAQGAFDSSRFDESSPAFQTASNACESLQPAGPTPVVPGRGNVSGP